MSNDSGGNITVPKKVMILPYGQVNSTKGDFLVDDVSIREICAFFSSRKLDVVIDYEHQTLGTEKAPAAGWIKNLYGEGTKGLMADVEWTESATLILSQKEYRYLSPVVMRRESDKRATQLHSVALTNSPAINGMQPLILNTRLSFFKAGQEAVIASGSGIQLTDGVMSPVQRMVNHKLGLTDEVFLKYNHRDEPEAVISREENELQVMKQLGITKEFVNKHIR